MVYIAVDSTLIQANQFHETRNDYPSRPPPAPLDWKATSDSDSAAIDNGTFEWGFMSRLFGGERLDINSKSQRRLTRLDQRGRSTVSLSECDSERVGQVVCHILSEWKIGGVEASHCPDILS